MASFIPLGSDDLRIVVVGNTAVGKTATANIILGQEAFREAKTTKCEIKKEKVDGRNISVIDTPGINSTTLSSEHLKTEMRRCLSLSDPGPHVFLLVIRVGNFTEDQRNTVKWIQENFGEEALKFTMVLFSGREEMTSSQWRTFSEETNVYNFTKQFGGGYAVINSKREINTVQIIKLLEKIEEVVKQNRGQHYTDQIYEAIQKCNAEETDRHDEEQRRTERERKKLVQERHIQEQGTPENQNKRGQDGEMQKLERKKKEEEQRRRDKNMTQENINRTMEEETQQAMAASNTVEGTESEIKEGKAVEDEIRGKHVRKFPSKANREKERLKQDFERQQESRREREKAKWENERISTEGHPDTVSDVRIVLMGTPGSGKSATGNTILGREAFGKDLIKVPNTVTVYKRQDGMVGNKSVTVIDTKLRRRIFTFLLRKPNIFEFMFLPSEVVQCLQLCSPGPHVFLLVARNFWRVYGSFNLRYMFGEEFLKRSIVLITHGDKHRKVEKRDFGWDLEQLVDSCGGRYHVFNNEEQEDRTQVTELLEKIENLMEENEGKPYTTEMYQAHSQRMQEERSSCSVL